MSNPSSSPVSHAQILAFDFGLLAVFVPILQLVEQRVLTPTVGMVQKKGCNPRVILGALIVLVVSLPGAILKAVAAFGGGGGGGGGGVNVGGAIATCCQKVAILFGRSLGSGDVKKGAMTETRSRRGAGAGGGSAGGAGGSSTPATRLFTGGDGKQSQGKVDLSA